MPRTFFINDPDCSVRAPAPPPHDLRIASDVISASSKAAPIR